jgi:hypothetical protein
VKLVSISNLDGVRADMQRKKTIVLFSSLVVLVIFLVPEKQISSKNSAVTIATMPQGQWQVYLPLVRRDDVILFNRTDDMESARLLHTATLLANGKVLVAGGAYTLTSMTPDLRTAELYDPTTSEWYPTGSLHEAREGHSAALLPDGKVLVAGGLKNNGVSVMLTSAELYDPTTGTWNLTGNMNIPRYGHKAILLLNGKVLVIGGYDFAKGWIKETELYDPITGIWSLAGDLYYARMGHSATLLPNGKVLVVGGQSEWASGSAELYDPDTGFWEWTQGPTIARTGHTATLLSTGKVLVTGGCYISHTGSTELYDPDTGTWRITGSLSIPRCDHFAAPMKTGRVMVVDGSVSNGKYDGIVESGDPVSGQWSVAGKTTCDSVTAIGVVLSDGRLLLTGGESTTNRVLNCTEIGVNP